jgi:hypothetical protein
MAGGPPNAWPKARHAVLRDLPAATRYRTQSAASAQGGGAVRGPTAIGVGLALRRAGLVVFEEQGNLPLGIVKEAA